MQTLNDIKPNTILEAESYKMIGTKIGRAPCVKYTSEVIGKRIKGRSQFNGQCEERIPCLIHYGGKKNMDGGKTYHDLNFISDTENDESDNDNADFSDDFSQRIS